MSLVVRGMGRVAGRPNEISLYRAEMSNGKWIWHEYNILNSGNINYRLPTIHMTVARNGFSRNLITTQQIEYLMSSKEVPEEFIADITAAYLRSEFADESALLKDREWWD